MFFKKGEREERVGGSRGWIELLADYNKWNRYSYYFFPFYFDLLRPSDPPTPRPSDPCIIFLIFKEKK